MKIGIISDIHANIYGLRAVLEKLPGVDMILCAGDIVGYYTFVNEVVDEIRDKKITSILGNHDAYVLGMLPLPQNPITHAPIAYAKKHLTAGNTEFLKSIGTARRKFTVDGLNILMCHGSPWDNWKEYIYPDFTNFEKFHGVDADIIILGHTHRPMIKKVGEKIIINPGSCGQPRDTFTASYAIFDTKTKDVSIKRVSYDIEKVAVAAEGEHFDEKVVALLRRGMQSA